MFAGKRILIVEDEAVIAFALEDILTDLGATVVGPAGRMEEACGLAEGEAIDAAILDVNLNYQPSYPVATILRARGIPFAFATGYDQDGLNWDEPVVVVAKPYRQDEIEDALRRLLKL